MARPSIVEEVYGYDSKVKFNNCNIYVDRRASTNNLSLKESDNFNNITYFNRKNVIVNFL